MFAPAGMGDIAESRSMVRNHVWHTNCIILVTENAVGVLEKICLLMFVIPILQCGNVGRECSDEDLGGGKEKNRNGMQALYDTRSDPSAYNVSPDIFPARNVNGDIIVRSQTYGASEDFSNCLLREVSDIPSRIEQKYDDVVPCIDVKPAV